ncbi:hypothetical protein NDA16_004046 [Ustilago loliicola]|nr:hypothetical protein NDA16_004046 [Ustilago loliicola]
MFQPTWSQEAAAQNPLNLHADPNTNMHLSQHNGYDASNIAFHPPSDQRPMYDGSSISTSNGAPPSGSASDTYSLQQQKQQSHQLASGHNNMDESHPFGSQHASAPSDAPLFLDGSSMSLHNSNLGLGQHASDPSSQSYPQSLGQGFSDASESQTNNFIPNQNHQYPSRPQTGSEQSWSQQDGSVGSFSTGLQRAARPAALKIVMASVASSDYGNASQHEMSGAVPNSAGLGTAATPLQTRFAPLPQLQPSMYDEQAALVQQHTNSANQTSTEDAAMPSSSALMPAFGSEGNFLNQGAGSRSPAPSQRNAEHASDSPQLHQGESLVGMPGIPDRLGASSSHLGVSASPSSPMMSQLGGGGGQNSPSSTLSGAFSRPGSRPVSRGLKSVASFTSSAGTGTASASEALMGRPRSSSGSGVAVRPISALTRTSSMQSELASHQAAPHHPGLTQSRSVQNLGQVQSPAMSAHLSSPRNPGHPGMEPWSPAHSQMAQSHGFRGSFSGPGFQTPQMPQFSPTLTSPAQSQYSPQAHFGSHTPGIMPFFSPSIETTHQFNSSNNLASDFEIAGFSEQRLSSALANSASISSAPSTGAHPREGHSTPTIVEEEEDTSQSDGRAMMSRHMQNDLRLDGSFPPHAHQHQHPYPQQRHPHPHQHPHQQHSQHEHQQQQQHTHFVAAQPPPVLQRSRSDVQGMPMDAPSTSRNQMSYPPSMRPSLYQQVSMAEMNQLRQIHGLGVSERNFGDCSAFIEDYIRQYISTPSRLGLGERNVLIMTTKVAQKSYGAEKRFLCPPPLVILIGSSWWNACPASTRPSPFSPAGPTDLDQAPTVLSPPRVTINISGEPGIQDGALEWASSSGRLIDVGNPSSEMAISGRCIGKQLYISDVDEKRRHVEALVAISVPGSSPMDRRLLGTFPSRPIKVISKPSKKRQSSRNTELCVNHGSVISLFHRLRSQTVSTRYLCVSGAPSWFKGSDNQPFLNMNPRDQKGQEPPSCFVAKMSSWDPFIIYLVDPKKRADATPSEPLQPPVKGYPPPPPNALPTTGLTSSQMTIHYNQPIVLQCLNTAVVSPVMVVRKVERGTTVLGGASAGPTESLAREEFGDPVSQLHKIALEVLEDPSASVPRPAGESGEPMSPGHSGPFLACLNESVGMHRPSEPRKWVGNSSFSVPSTPTTPVTSMNLAAMEAGDIPSGGYLPTSPTAAAAYAAAQTRYSLNAARGGSMMSPSASSSSHDVSAMEPPPSSDGGKVKRPRRVSSSVVVQKERAVAAAASKNRRRGQSLSVVGMQNQGLSEVEIIRRTGSYANSLASDSSAAGSAAPGAMWSVEVADSDIWTVVGTDIARHSFYVPPQVVGGSAPQTNITDGNIAHLITVPAPSQPITPIPVISNVVAPGRDGRSPMPAPPGDQSPGLVTILGENFHPNLFVFFGDWKSTHVEVRTRQTIVCLAPPAPQSLPLKMSAAAGTTRKLKVLMAHGYTSNKFQFFKRSGAIRKACRDVADFTFIKGPLIVQPITFAGDLDAPDTEESKVIDESTPIEEQPRAWWRLDDDGNYLDWDKSVDYINQVLKAEGPFDGIVGFSQGGCLAGILTSAFEKPELLPGLQLPKGQGAFKFAVAVSGFRSRDPLHQKLFETPIETPVLHVLGRTDQIVDLEFSQTLVDVCKNSRVEFHDGGHSLPSKAPWRNFFRDFFSTFTSDPYVPNNEWKTIPGPSERPRGETPAGSGTVTPTREATEAATSSSTATEASAAGERDIDPSNPARSVPKKKANSPFLVHRKWKQEQELRRRKAEEQGSNSGSSGSGKGKSGVRSFEEPTTDLSGPVRVMIKMFRFLIMAIAALMVTGFFIAGDPLWGYRGKYTKLRTYMPYREKIFSLPELAMYNGRDSKKPVYIAILGDVYDVSAGRHIYGPGGYYSFFSGRDASRAYVTGCFKTHLTYDVRDFDDKQMNVGSMFSDA